MSAEVGQWDLESLCCYFFFPLPLSFLMLSCQWKMSNAIRREEDDELRRISGKEQEGERKETDRAAGLGPFLLADGAARAKTDPYLRSRGREEPLSLHLDAEATI